MVDILRTEDPASLTDEGCGAHSWPARRYDYAYRERRTKIADNWQLTLPSLVRDFSESVKTNWLEAARFESLETEVMLLKDRYVSFEKTAPLVVPIQTLAPEPFEIVKPFSCVVRSESGNFIASFVDANLSASGDTQTEAVLNLKDVIVGTFEMLMELAPEALGPGPARQRAVLEEFIKKRD